LNSWKILDRPLIDIILCINAMGTQVAIAEQIVDGEGDYILALKANQNGLFQQAKNASTFAISSAVCLLISHSFRSPFDDTGESKRPVTGVWMSLMAKTD